MDAKESPVWKALVEQRVPLVVGDADTSSLWQDAAAVAAGATEAGLYVPLLKQVRVGGYFLIKHREPRPFTSNEIELAQALSQQATLAMQLAQLAEQQERSAVVAERNRLAREIHDTLAQGFTGILIQLEAAEDVLQGEPATVAQDGGREEALIHLSRARELARESLQEARRSVQALRPRALEGQDLPAAVRHMVQQQTMDSGIQATVKVEGERRPLPSSLTSELLRIAQEAVTNALRHGAAADIEVTLSYLAHTLVLTVRDDGGGFDTQAAQNGFGLTSMRERAALIGAQLDVSSQPGEGTQLSCVVPLPTRANS